MSISLVLILLKSILYFPFVFLVYVRYELSVISLNTVEPHNSIIDY